MIVAVLFTLKPMILLNCNCDFDMLFLIADDRCTLLARVELLGRQVLVHVTWESIVCIPFGSLSIQTLAENLF